MPEGSIVLFTPPRFFDKLLYKLWFLYTNYIEINICRPTAETLIRTFIGNFFNKAFSHLCAKTFHCWDLNYFNYLDLLNSLLLFFSVLRTFTFNTQYFCTFSWFDLNNFTYVTSSMQYFHHRVHSLCAISTYWLHFCLWYFTWYFYSTPSQGIFY